MLQVLQRHRNCRRPVCTSPYWKRGTESEAQRETRRRDARFELDQARLYDYLVVNDDLEAAAARVGAIILAERSRTARQAPRWAALWKEIEGG